MECHCKLCVESQKGASRPKTKITPPPPFDDREADVVNLPGIELRRQITVRETSWADSPTHATDPSTQALSPALSKEGRNTVDALRDVAVACECMRQATRLCQGKKCGLGATIVSLCPTPQIRWLKSKSASTSFILTLGVRSFEAKRALSPCFML